MKTLALSILILWIGLVTWVPKIHAGLDTNRIVNVTGLPGTWSAAEGVFKITAPRNDLPVAVDGWTMPAFMGLTTWAAFTEGKKAEAMVTGDFVLFEDEVNPVMTAALENGLAVTALHNHFFFDEPKVYFMHIGGEGAVEQLAQGVKAALASQKEVRASRPKPARVFGTAFVPGTNAITVTALETVLGHKAQAKDGMAKFVIGREARMPCGCAMTKEMGVNTWAAFAGTDDNAVVDGDFAVLEDELQRVLKSLRREKVNIVAIHHHMTHESPRFLFLHYWGRGPALRLAESLQRVLLEQTTVLLNSTPATLRSALTFHASFDGRVDADFALGDGRLRTAAAMNKRAEAAPGLPTNGFVVHAKGQGRFGDGLRFKEKSGAVVFFNVAKNLEYRDTNWSGTVSFWLSTDPAGELQPGFCDPIQITPRAWNDAAFFVEFEKRPAGIPFRLGAYADFKVWNPGNRKWEEIPMSDKPLLTVDQPPFGRGKWTHVVFTFERFNTGRPDGVARLYLDGEPRGALSARTQTFTWDSEQASVMLGLSYVGLYDEVSLFRRALSEAEVRQLHGLEGGVGSLLK